ncbi:MAG TPA: ABC transporter ATP-binding protein [Kofleriaceae bacterium]|nr:ABC transporter ATP-binding protein [Kofleriaceae bacterium]
MNDAPRHRSFPTLVRFGRPHRRALIVGVLGSAAWVACRLAMPWPLRGVVELVFAESGTTQHGTVLEYLPSSGSPLVWLLVGYVAIIAGLGVAEMVQRLHLSGFASRTARDLRSAASESVNSSGGSIEHGELVVRLVSDVARVKSDLKGILVHATQNGLLFLCICVLLLFMSPLMALFLLVGGAVTIWIGFAAARRVARVAEAARAREGEFAASLVAGLDAGEAIPTSRKHEGRRETGLARLVTVSSLLTHLALAVTVAAALAVGVHEVRTGALGAGELFLFIAYVLMVHRRLIQLGRQLVRTGKLRASLDRLAALLERPGEIAAARPLSVGLRLEGLRVDSPRTGKARLGPLDLAIAAGERVAVVGKSGAGKSTLLRVLARLQTTSNGAIVWDASPLAEIPPTSTSYLAQLPQLPARPVWEILGLPGPELVPSDKLRTLERAGAWKVVQGLPKGLRQVVSSRSLSPGEARALSAGRVALSGGSLWLLDALDEGLGTREAVGRLDAILARAGGRTVIAAFVRLRAPDRFGRVIALKRGQVVFDGTPAAWQAWRAGDAKAEAS